jgi:hyperosmotically inducible periplasmic protein
MSKHVLWMVPALALGAALVGCNRADNGQTVGQRVDETVAKTEQRTEQTKEGVKDAGAKAADAVSDATITAEVKAALAADPQLSALRIDVDTANGVVTLKGPAPDEKSRSRATQIAAAPKGVMRVDNQLTLKGA